MSSQSVSLSGLHGVDACAHAFVCFLCIDRTRPEVAAVEQRMEKVSHSHCIPSFEQLQ